MRTHVDLFTGLGGFALAAQANGVQTVAMCEIDANCQAFLRKAWPEVELHDDVRTFDAIRYAGAWLVTGGVPCQPASRAGKQRGSEDDRWLWPDAIRVISDIRPTWALLENPPGIGDVGLAGVLSDLEGIGYETRVFGIPACAVGAPHRRERYWIVAHSESLSGWRDIEERGQTRRDADGRDRAHDVADTQGVGQQWQIAARTGRWQSETPHRDRSCSFRHWDNSVYVPCADGKFRRAPDDTFDVAHGLHRSLLAALGNSIVPQVAERIIAAMIEAEQ